jgi:hypothetical protein
MSAALTFAPQACDLLRRHGYHAVVMERWEPTHSGGKIRRDFPYSKHGGFADILAWRPLRIREAVFAPIDGYDLHGVLAVQVCSESNIMAHYHKIVSGTPYADVRDWLLAGNRLEIFAFPTAKRKSRRAGPHRQLNLRFIRFSFTDELLWEDATELSCFGYDNYRVAS